MPSFSALLVHSPDMPLEVRAALVRARAAHRGQLADAWRRRAAWLIEDQFDLSECDARELVDLPRGARCL